MHLQADFDAESLADNSEMYTSHYRDDIQKIKNQILGLWDALKRLEKYGPGKQDAERIGPYLDAAK